MPTKRDYYEVLEVSRDADAVEIKRAYRKLALKFHPDNYKGEKAEGEAKFKELAEAYEVLSDEQKRARYDQFGHEGLRGSGMHDFSSMGFGDIFSMFEEIFGGGVGGGGRRGRGSTGRSRRGLDLETEVELSLEEVATGTEQTLEFERMDLCEACGGSGAKPGTQPDRCETCGGYGQVQQRVNSFFGVSVRVTPCPNCNGQGQWIRQKCPDCSGSGRSRKQRTLTVHIPAGIRDGQVVRVRGEGEPGQGPGGEAAGNLRGDLHVYVRVTPHPLLARRGDDLLCQVPVSYSTAALGGTVKVPTLTGPEDLDIPAGSQNGELLTLKRRGLPSLQGGRTGDQHVQLFIEVPRKLSARQKDLLRQLAECDGDSTESQRKSFLETLKSYFKDKTTSHD